MNRTILAAIVAAIALPSMAQAHTTRADLRHDNRVVHREQRELARARHHHDHRLAHMERRELKAARHDRRDDVHDFRRTH
ncbi:MAG: hypothetical protein KGM49_08075 [Sphingomonadales bacterium]|nr:hypothetical protein [Sphingomonadales bacterium]